MIATTINEPSESYQEEQLSDAISSLPAYGTVLKPLSGHNHWAFFKYIQAVTGDTLTEAEKELLNTSLKIKKLRRRQYFLQEGDPCKYIGFIIKGSAKMYSINDRGQESIIAFGLENNWMADLQSFLSSGSSCYHIEMLEDTEMVTIDRNRLFQLSQSIPAFHKMFCLYHMDQTIDCQKRINAALSMTAEERYLDLLASKPEYPQRFSQNMLACYLGIKPETLSRIRKR